MPLAGNVIAEYLICFEGEISDSAMGKYLEIYLLLLFLFRHSEMFDLFKFFFDAFPLLSRTWPVHHISKNYVLIMNLTTTQLFFYFH